MKIVVFFIQLSLQFVSQGPINNTLDGISSDNGFALKRQQAIIWTNDGLFSDKYVHHLAMMS